MRTMKREKKLCLICMEEHEVQTVVLEDTEEFKGKEVSFEAIYEYCDVADEFLETEEMIRANSLAMKDAYRGKVGLLTSAEIIAIRDKYGISQKDFSEILDWGGATITRYENHQVQDRAHDDILRKIDFDPKWFLQMLTRAKAKISKKKYEEYYKVASETYKRTQNRYLIDSIQALYADFTDDRITGGVELNLNKVMETVNYYASKITDLHKVKCMKMLWYGDNVSFKRRGKSITGLVYKALPFGAVPVGYEQIVELDGVEYETVVYDMDRVGCKFHPVAGFQVNELSIEDVDILDVVIEEVGYLSTQEIIARMHAEDAYQCTESNCIIPFSFAEKLSIH